jgi:hypothetical protein
VGDRDPFHMDVIVITKIQEHLSCELSAIIISDRVRDAKTENYVLNEIHSLLGANFSQGLHLDPLSEFIDHDKQVGEAIGCILEGSQ